MPSPKAIAEVFGHICNLVGFGVNLQTILGTAETLTISDLTKVVRGEHGRFFNTVIIADIETSPNDFHNVWTPTVLDMNCVTGDDLSVGGSLYDICTKLSNSITNLHRDLKRLAAVFRQYEADLWVDEFTLGYYAFIEGL